MLVADLRHFLDISDDAPSSARRLGHHLTSIVKAATAREAGEPWVTAVGCIRRPARRPCPGTIGVRRYTVPASIRWECVQCGDEGVISGWEGTFADLRGESATGDRLALVVPTEMAQVLQSVMYLDSHLERMVFAGMFVGDGIGLEGREEDFDELADTVAAEANHEPNRPRRKRLDAAGNALIEALNSD